jgi:endonuclease/exonuclease/phosphatase family metal-dependent hydrolase
MGVMTAYPVNLYELVSMKIVRVSSGCNWPRRPDNRVRQYLQTTVDGLTYVVNYVSLTPLKTSVQEKWDDIQIASNKWNEILMMELKPRVADPSPGSSFVVTNYHMPCEFRKPDIMTTHAILAKQIALNYAAGLPLVMAGDWNLSSDSDGFKFITGKPEDDSLLESPMCYANVPEWLHCDKRLFDVSLKSTFHAIAHPTTPPLPRYTHCSVTQFYPSAPQNAFSGVIDHIFVSKRIRVLSSSVDGKQDDVPLPTTDEPSDHLMLKCTLEIRNG